MRYLSRLARHLAREERPWRWIVSRSLYFSGIGRVLTIRCEMYRLRFFPSALSLTKWLDPSFGANDEDVLRRILRPGDTVIDVGANIGTMTLTAAFLVGPSGRVIAFEPNRRIFKFLKKNVGLNECQNVTLHNAAVGDREGEVRFTDDRYDDQNHITDRGGDLVPITTLDRALSGIPGRFRLLKIDVEGYEKPVLQGAWRVLERTDYVYVEVAEKHFSSWGYTTPDLLRLLSRRGFALFRIGGDGQGVRLDPEFVPDKCLNILARRQGSDHSSGVAPFDRSPG